MTMSTFKPVAALALLFCFLTSPTQAQEYKEAYNAALEAAKSKDYSAARAAFTRAASLAIQEGDTEIADKSASIAAQIDYISGVDLVKKGQFDAALARFDDGIAINPGYVKNYEGRALALKKLDRIDEAIGAYEDLIAFGEEHGDSQAARKGQDGILSHFNHLASAALGRRAEPSPSDAREALDHLEELQSRVEPNANAYYYLAVAHNSLGDYDQAATFADQALSIHRGSRTDAAKIHLIRGEALMYAGNIAAAKEAFEDARYGDYKSRAEHHLDSL